MSDTHHETTVNELAISVIVPAYNAEATLAETLDAIQAQSYTNWECVIVDDGSSDRTRAIAEEYAACDERFVVVSQENRGSGGAYNTGVRTASHAFVCICSADDVLLPEHLKGIARAIKEKPEVDIFSTNGYFWMPNGSRTIIYRGPEAKQPHSWPLKQVISVCFFSVGATYRKSWFDVVNGYREDVFGEDWDFWLRIMAQGATHLFIPQASALHRVSDFQKSADATRAYRSDIRIIEDLIESFDLDDEALSAARTCIARRETLIKQAEEAKPVRSSGPIGRIKLLIRTLLDTVFGSERIERILRSRKR